LYVIGLPAVTEPWSLSVFVIDRSSVGLSASVSVALLFPGLISENPGGGVIVAVFVRTPMADDWMVATTV
jgi:hypothetical protein